MARARRLGDWERDLAGARQTEQLVAAALRGDGRFEEFVDCTDAFDRLDFAFRYRGQAIALDVKEKLQRHSRAVQQLWPEVAEQDLFIVDETVYRRVVWQGGGGYLAIHDVPSQRWVIFGPWELTLGRHVRYGRWGQRNANPFLKGKLLIDLSSGASQGDQFDLDLLTTTITQSSRWRDRVEPYPIDGARLRELGQP